MARQERCLHHRWRRLDSARPMKSTSLRQSLQQAHEWYRPSRPDEVILRSWASWQEVVEVPILGYPQRGDHQRVHPVDGRQPSSSCQHAPLLAQVIQAQAHPRLVRRIRCEVQGMPAAVDNLHEQYVVCDDIWEGHPLVRFVGHKHMSNLCS